MAAPTVDDHQGDGAQMVNFNDLKKKPKVNPNLEKITPQK